MNKRQLKKEYRKAQTEVLILSQVNSSLRFQLRGQADRLRELAREYRGHKVVADRGIWQAKLEATQYKKALDRAQAEKLTAAAVPKETDVLTTAESWGMVLTSLALMAGAAWLGSL